MMQFENIFLYGDFDNSTYYDCVALVPLGEIRVGEKFSSCWLTKTNGYMTLFCAHGTSGFPVKLRINSITENVELRTTQDSFTIHKQTQLTPTSCVPCCIAMITGISQQTIIDEMKRHNDESAGQHAEFRQWVRMGWLPTILPYPDLHLGRGNIMLATVPSLNINGGNHRIVIDYREDITIYDPNEGREGRKVYTWPLRSWSELTTVEYCFGRDLFR